MQADIQYFYSCSGEQGECVRLQTANVVRPGTGCRCSFKSAWCAVEVGETVAASDFVNQTITNAYSE
jgi:hypothetical protein